jgi:hypothetical protein
VSYWVRAGLGLALFVAGLAAFDYAVYALVQTGTCASGGAYVSARACPAGTAEKAMLIPGGVIAGMFGLMLLARRGRRSGAPDGPRRLNGGLFGWSALFISLGIVALLATIGPGAEPSGGARWVGFFLCGLFVPMGLAPLVASLAGRRLRRSQGPALDAAAIARRAAAARSVLQPEPVAAIRTAGPAGDDPVDRLRRLGELRDSGVLTPSEFDAAKARLLAEL